MLSKIQNLETVTAAPMRFNSQMASVPASAVQVAKVVEMATSDNYRGAYRYELGSVVEKGSIPKSSSFKAANTNASGSADQTIYIFNEDILNSSPAISSTLLESKTYNDGFSGKLINKIIALANSSRGIKCKGFNIMFKDADGNQDSSALYNANFTIQSYTGIGGKTDPVVLDLSQAIRNTQFQQGLLTIDCEFWVNGITQISLNLPKGYTVEVNFNWEA